MVREGVDFSYSPPTGAELKAAGRTCAMVYVTDPGENNKGVSQARWNDLTSHGISIGFVWELGTNAALGGYSQGVADATNAQANLNALSGPSNKRPLYFALDWDVRPSEYSTVKAYFQGINHVIGASRSGAYGHYDILAYLTKQKVIVKRWQTYAWSYGKIISPIDVLQYSNGHTLGSGTVDYDRFYSSNWGQRSVLWVAPAPKPPVVPPKPDPPVKYTVKSGDSLTVIAARYNTSVAAVLRLNKSITNPDFIKVGQTIRVK